MKSSFIKYWLLLVITICLIPQSAHGLGIEVAGGFWGQHPSGYIQSEPFSSNDKLDLEQDLNYDDEYKPFGRIKVDLPLFLPNLYLMATPMEFEEASSKNTSFKFGDQIFVSTLPFDSRLQLDHYDIALYYSVPLIETATLKRLNAEIGINIRIIDFEAKITQDATGVTESKNFTVGLPMIYAGIQLNPVDLISLEAEARGIAYNSDYYYDLIGRVKVKPFGPFFIAGGYRYESIEFDEKDVEASIKFKGPFIEAGLVF